MCPKLQVGKEVPWGPCESVRGPLAEMKLPGAAQGKGALFLCFREGSVQVVPLERDHRESGTKTCSTCRVPGCAGGSGIGPALRTSRGDRDMMRTRGLWLFGLQWNFRETPVVIKSKHAIPPH